MKKVKKKVKMSKFEKLLYSFAVILLLISPICIVFSKATLSKINFEVENENFDLDINYLKRKNETWEGDVGNSIYHYFNNSEDHIINNSLFQITPSILIYNNKSKINDFLVKITVSNLFSSGFPVKI